MKTYIRRTRATAGQLTAGLASTIWNSGMGWLNWYMIFMIWDWAINENIHSKNAGYRWPTYGRFSIYHMEQWNGMLELVYDIHDLGLGNQ